MSERIEHKHRNRIKVLFFYPNEFFGPEMTVFTNIIRHLDRSRFTPYMVVNRDAEGALALTEEDGVLIKRLKLGRSLTGAGRLAGLRSWVHLPMSMAALVRFARKERIHVVQCVAGARAGTLAYMLARLSGAKLLFHYHNLPKRYAGLRNYFKQMVGQHADHSAAVSNFIAERVLSTGVANRVDTVWNSVDLDRFNPQVDGSALRREYGIAPDAPLVLQLARLIYWKRQEDLIRGFAIARRHVPELRCLIVGWEDPRYSGPYPSYRAELEDICRQEGLGDSLIIADARPEAPQLIAAADMVVMPSEEDPCPLVVLEAMAVGRPVIGTASGGISEQVVDGVTGFLVPTRSPQAIADKIVLLATNPELRTRMGVAARRRAEQYFHSKRLGEEFGQVYEHMVAERGRKQAVPPLQPRSERL